MCRKFNQCGAGRMDNSQGEQMNITIQHHEDVHFSAHHENHKISIDLPENLGGGNRGMNPPQLFVAALGACVGVYVADYCDSHAIPYQGMQLQLSWKYKDKPRRIGSVNVRLELPSGSLSNEHQQGIQDSIQQCLLHNTLAQKPDFNVNIIPTEAKGRVDGHAHQSECVG